MTKMASNRKQQILEITAELIQKKGFSAFSYQDIADQINISKAAIHSHFRTKEILGNEFLAYYLEETKKMHRQSEKSGSSAWDKFDFYISMMENMTIVENKICPVTVLQVECNIIPESMKVGLSKIYKCEREWLIKIFKQGLVDGDMSFDETVENKVSVVQTLIQGAIITARAENSESFNKIIDLIRITMK